MVGLDTNVVLRWLVDTGFWPDDSPGQTATVAKLLANTSDRFYMNAIVLAETLWVLENPLNQPKTVLLHVLDRLLAASNLVVENEDAIKAAAQSYGAHRSDIHDRMIAETNMRAGCSHTLTFDAAAAKTPGFRLLKSRG